MIRAGVHLRISQPFPFGMDLWSTRLLHLFEFLALIQELPLMQDWASRETCRIAQSTSEGI